MLKVKNLSFDVMEDGIKKNILKDVSFEVKKGEMLIITGPNGSGKSTLAKVLMGIEKAAGGSVYLGGEDISDLAIDERAKAGLGFAFQQPPRFKGMTIEKLLCLAAGRKLPEKECCDLLSGVGLCAREYLGRQADATLSGGEMKRIEIATALAKPHKICIFDEPEAGIDLWSFSMLVKRFEEIHKNKDESIIIISHQERLIQMADRIMLLKDGQVKKIGTRDEMLTELMGVQETKGCLDKHQIPAN
ncbi:MAG: ATP-binding cassette domain-containing protein [Lachnospiraceae bacterium]|nr:ATP-binding cassette domain-containing protein [Lachnospiraceae bacterium]